MALMPPPLEKPPRRSLRVALAMHMHDPPRKLQNPIPRRPRIRSHPRQTPVRNQHRAVRSRRLGLQHRIAFPAQPAPPRGIPSPLQFEQALEKPILIQHRQLQRRADPHRQRALAAAWQSRHQNEWPLHRYRLYPIARRKSRRFPSSSTDSTPFGDDPSITPITPRPCSVSATITSTGFAVAQ